jgi:NADPH:quinone reductase-like Zn-dependent oxidoreductase
LLKVAIHKPGSYNRLLLEEAPDPQAGPGEVRIAVEAIGVNYADCLVRMGLYASAKEYVGWPITPGFDAAGTIDQVGEGVVTHSLGEPVVAVTRFGGYASKLVVRAGQAFSRPARLGVQQAAGFPTVFLTAYYALFEMAGVRPGQWLLVHSAAGGVGSALVQIGRLAQGNVVGVVGASHKVETVERLGATAVIDKSQTPLWPAAERLSPAGYHAIFDANGAETLRESYHHLAVPGKLVVYGFHTMLPRSGGKPRWLKLARDYLRTPRFNPLDMVTRNRSVLAFNLSYLFAENALLSEAMGRLFGWLEAGQIEPPTVTAFALRDVAEAHRVLESGQTIGKLVLTT